MLFLVIFLGATMGTGFFLSWYRQRGGKLVSYILMLLCILTIILYTGSTIALLEAEESWFRFATVYGIGLAAGLIGYAIASVHIALTKIGELNRF